MDVYFVRHGETDGNVARRHQHDNTVLNEKGREQIFALSKRIAEIKPTHIVSSTNLRAVETAKIISLNSSPYLIPDTNSAFEEIRRPRWLIGSRHVSLISAWYIWRWFFDVKRKEEMESYGPFLQRVKEAREYLENLPENSRVVVVSHAVFITIFMEHLCSDKRMSIWRAFKRLWHVVTMSNVDIIHLRHIPEEKSCRWKVVD